MVRNRRNQDRASSRDPGKEFREAKENEKEQTVRLQKGQESAHPKLFQDILLQKKRLEGGW